MRGARSGLRVDWRAPYGMASDTFTNIVQLAEKIKTTRSHVVGYGLATTPISGLSQDTVQRPCSLPMHKPAGCERMVKQLSVGT